MDIGLSRGRKFNRMERLDSVTCGMCMINYRRTLKTGRISHILVRHWVIGLVEPAHKSPEGPRHSPRVGGNTVLFVNLTNFEQSL